MENNNFDDFLLDPSHDDLDSLHLEAERQLLKKGGFKKLVKKIKNKLTSKKKKTKLVKAAKSSSTTDAQAAQIEKVASTNPKGSQQMGKPTKETLPKKILKKKDTSGSDPKVNAPAPKKIAVKKKSFSEAFRENRKMLGAGKTFTWNGKKYSTNTADDLAKKKKPVTKPKVKVKPTALDEITLTNRDSDTNEFYANSTSIRRGETKVVKKKGTGGKKLYKRGGKK